MCNKYLRNKFRSWYKSITVMWMSLSYGSTSSKRTWIKLINLCRTFSLMMWHNDCWNNSCRMEKLKLMNLVKINSCVLNRKILIVPKTCCVIGFTQIICKVVKSSPDSTRELIWHLGTSRIWVTENNCLLITDFWLTIWKYCVIFWK